jgi:hypothetical protein
MRGPTVEHALVHSSRTLHHSVQVDVACDDGHVQRNGGQGQGPTRIAVRMRRRWVIRCGCGGWSDPWKHPVQAEMGLIRTPIENNKTPPPATTTAPSMPPHAHISTHQTPVRPRLTSADRQPWPMTLQDHAESTRRTPPCHRATRSLSAQPEPVRRASRHTIHHAPRAHHPRRESGPAACPPADSCSTFPAREASVRQSARRPKAVAARANPERPCRPKSPARCLDGPDPAATGPDGAPPTLIVSTLETR